MTNDMGSCRQVAPDLQALSFPKVTRVPHPLDTVDTPGINSLMHRSQNSRRKEGRRFVTLAGRSWKLQKTSFLLSGTVQGNCVTVRGAKCIKGRADVTMVEPEDHQHHQGQAHLGVHLSPQYAFCPTPNKLYLRNKHQCDLLDQAWSLRTLIFSPVSPGILTASLSYPWLLILSPILSLPTLEYNHDTGFRFYCIFVYPFPVFFFFHGFKLFLPRAVVFFPSGLGSQGYSSSSSRRKKSLSVHRN